MVQGQTRTWAHVGQYVQRSGLLLAFIVLCVILALLSDRFLTLPNILNVLRQSSINGIIAVGMTLVILTRGIDLSVGAVLALTAVITAELLVLGVPPVSASIIGMLAGGLLGLFNGVIVTVFHLPAFIATLGTMTFARGLALNFTQGKPVTGLPEAFRWLGTGFIATVPVPVIAAGMVFLIAVVVLKGTVHGERIYALGNNPEAARFTGIPVKAYITMMYVITGILTALAGQILVGRLDSAQPVMGMGYEFNAIAAVVVGGTSLAGGSGGIAGTIIGVLIIAVINNGLNLLNVPSFWEQVVRGVVIASALLVHRASARKKSV
ncbi:MAG: ABC transporter permease [Salinispira sp.]